MGNIIVSAITFRKKENDWEFLLLKRTPEQGNFWQAPGGSVDEEDKTYLDAAYREVFEESGINKNQVLSVIKDVYYFSFDTHHVSGKPIKKSEVFVFGFEVEQNVVVNIKDNVCDEHEDYKWVSFNEALEMLEWENNKEAFRSLHSILSNLN